MKATEGVTESLKQHDQMEWFEAMKSIRNRAEEISFVNWSMGRIKHENSWRILVRQYRANRVWHILLQRIQDATRADLQAWIKTQSHDDGRIERFVWEIHRLCARKSDHYRLSDIPERLEAGCQDDVGSQGRIIEHITTALIERWALLSLYWM